MAVDVDDFLAHYGVPGMKWGKRKAQAIASAHAERKALPSSDDHLQTRATAKKPTRTLSNKEIKAFNERIQMEKKFSELKLEQHPTKKVESFLKIGLGLAATASSVYALAQSPMGKAAIEAGKNALGRNAANKGAIEAAKLLAKSLG